VFSADESADVSTDLRGDVSTGLAEECLGDTEVGLAVCIE